LLEREVPGLNVELCFNSRDFINRLPHFEGAVVWFFKEQWMESAFKLKLIATPAAGKDWIEVDEGKGLQISFGGFHGSLIAESVIGAMFYFLKALPLSVAMQKQKKWARNKISKKFQSLYKSRVTILGFGKIGNAIAERLKPFGCKITGIKRKSTPTPNYFTSSDRVLNFENWKMIFAETDHLICALPGDASGVLKIEHFQILPKSCYFYNVGRGNVCQESALVEVLEAGEIAGAYLDVFEEEPLPESSSLWKADNVLIHPHLSAASPQYLELFVEELAKKINAGDFG
jgi:D-2-hydroxyacid dehydrogenase (NADP+)